MTATIMAYVKTPINHMCHDIHVKCMRRREKNGVRMPVISHFETYCQKRNFLKNVGVVIRLSCSYYPCNTHWHNVKFLKRWGCTYNPTLH